MPLDVFISYAYQDRKLRDELAVHQCNLQHKQVISDWFDGDIIQGTEWEQEILDHLRTAKIILLLISAHFMSSSFCWDIEMKDAIDRHEAKQARVVPKCSSRDSVWTKNNGMIITGVIPCYSG